MAITKRPAPVAAKKAAAAPATKQVAAAPTKASTAVVKIPPVAVAHVPSMSAADMLADSGAGMAGMTKDDFLIPRIKIAQDLTKATKKNRPEYIEGLEVGMFYNPVTGEMWDGAEGLLVVLVQFQKTYPEFIPFSKGGGFVTNHDEGIMAKAKFVKGEGFRLPSGNEVTPTIEYFAFLINEETGDFQQILISLSKDDMTEARRLSTVVSTYRDTVQDDEGNDVVLAPPALFHRTYRWTAAPKQKVGDYFGWKFAPGPRTIDLFPETGEGVTIYNAARAFREQIAKGAVKVAAPLSDEPGGGSTMDESAPM